MAIEAAKAPETRGAADRGRAEDPAGGLKRAAVRVSFRGVMRYAWAVNAVAPSSRSGPRPGGAAWAAGGDRRRGRRADGAAAGGAGSVRGRAGAGRPGGMTARRLQLNAPPRSARIFDALELFAFVRPAPVLRALGGGTGAGAGPARAEEARRRRPARCAGVCARLLAELAETPEPSREEALAVAETLGRAGWAWAPAAIGALRSQAAAGRPWRGIGPGRLVAAARVGGPGAAGRGGLQADRPGRRARERLARAAGARRARRGAADPGRVRRRDRLRLPAPRPGGRAAHDAGRGRHRRRQDPGLSGAGLAVGRGATARRVWISTYTRALQRQIERESHALYPDPAVRARRRVVRKGRENYLCLLNFQER